MSETQKFMYWYCPDPYCLRIYICRWDRWAQEMYRARCTDHNRHTLIEIWVGEDGLMESSRPPKRATGHNGRHIPGQGDEYRLQGWTPRLLAFPAGDQAAERLGGMDAVIALAEDIVLRALPQDERRKHLSRAG